MYSVRTTKTASGAIAVQIVRYRHREKIIVKHIGSAHTSDELASLKEVARDWIEKENQQQPLFPKQTATKILLPIDKCRYLGFRYTFIYEILNEVFRLFRMDSLPQLLRDLTLIRIMQPASKLESLELLAEFFGKSYQRADLYRSIPEFVESKVNIERKFVSIARDHFNFDFSIVFYDVTTLYFESFKEDEEHFRKPGFSKDNKANQPQIVIGLIVTREGFPVAYDVFTGNTFEGKTFIPTITKFKVAHRIETLTIVADAAMISFENVEKLKEKKLSYIVGARVANVKLDQIRQIKEALENVDGKSMRIETERGLLVCDFSLKRYQKDKREMEKQIAKAEKQQEKKEGMKRTKFLMNRDKKKTEQVLNTDLVEKTKLLLGVKGYYTNLAEEPNKIIIDHYHNLWHVEKAFRIAKSDLAMRPIYHFKKQTIEAHILLCFMALAICKYMELKTGKSTKKIVKLLKSVTDARLKNLLTDEEIILRSEVNEQLQQLVKSLRY
jgi:transposase